MPAVRTSKRSTQVTAKPPRGRDGTARQEALSAKSQRAARRDSSEGIPFDEPTRDANEQNALLAGLLTPEDMQAVAEVFRLLQRWDREARASVSLTMKG